MLTETATTVSSEALDDAVRRAEGALLARQRGDGHWVFELEADATIPAEYVMLQHFLDEIDDGLNVKICAYLRRVQNPDGGWPLLPSRRQRCQLHRQGVLRAEALGRIDRRAAHGSRARARARSRWGGALQRVHAIRARDLRPGAVARGPRHARRARAGATLVSVPSRKDFVLVANRRHAAADPGGPTTARAQSAQGRPARALPSSAGGRTRLHAQPRRVRCSDDSS